MSDEPAIGVRGGAGGVQARFEDMYAMAGLTDDIGGDLLGAATGCHRALLDPDLVASALLDPVGAARFEAALVAALDGSCGLTRVAADVRARALQLRATAAGYEASDAAAAVLFELAPYFDTADALHELPTLLAGDTSWQGWLTDHPGIVDATLDVLPFGLCVLSGGRLPSDMVGTADLIAAFYPDGTPSTREIPFISEYHAQDEPPRDLEDLLVGLGERNLATPPQIDVRILEQTMPDGSVRRSVVVDIPGTKDWGTAPGRHSGNLNDLPTNLHTMAGDTTSQMRGVEQALALAGVTKDDAVMLVGHSQGGMTAVRAADELSGRYSITHVLTAGSPVGQMHVPESVRVLSLENTHDLVPHLDTRENPATHNRTTVSFSHQSSNVGDNHAITGSYVPAAAALDRSDDRSVQDFRETAGRFLNADAQSNHAYVITRTYP